MLKTARNLALNHVAKAENKNKQQLDDMDILLLMSGFQAVSRQNLAAPLPMPRWPWE